jgi:hypothetical protein
LTDDTRAWAIVRKSFPTTFTLGRGLPTEPRMTADECPPELVGTAWDPAMADGSEVAVEMLKPGMLDGIKTAVPDPASKAINGQAIKPPVRVARFEVA